MKTISRQEASLIQYFNQKNQFCFTNGEANKVYPLLSKDGIDKLLSNMAYKGLIMKIREGLYCIIPYKQESENFMPVWHSLAPYLAKGEDYYIGYYAALQIHQLNTQPSLKE
jgi:predicted transcriptional regulator of viral defense system